MPRDELMLDGFCLADIGPAEVDDREEENPDVFYALQLSLEALGPADMAWLSANRMCKSS